MLTTSLGCRNGSSRTPSDTETGAGDTASADTARDTSLPDTATDPACVDTEADIEGPFYRAGAPERDDLASPGDTGNPLRLSGRVLDADGCTPVAGAIVDVWHADPAGMYDNDSPEWRYRGRVATSSEGRWQLRTLEPGRYLNGPRYRPAHVHVKVWVGGVERLTTQLYFPGDPYNAEDPWYTPDLEVTRTGDGTATFDFAV